MRKVVDLLKTGWVQILLIVTALGGVPGITDLWDRFHPTPQLTRTPDQPAAQSLKKKIETGSLQRKSDSEPNFLDHPWDWLSWNKRQNEPKCDPTNPSGANRNGCKRVQED